MTLEEMTFDCQGSIQVTVDEGPGVPTGLDVGGEQVEVLYIRGSIPLQKEIEAATREEAYRKLEEFCKEVAEEIREQFYKEGVQAEVYVESDYLDVEASEE